MADFGIDIDPTEVGFDTQRLQRVDSHFKAYVDDGRLPGWQVMVSRHGRVAHLSSYGFADKESGRAVATDTIWRIYSMTKPVVSVAAMTLYEEGRLALGDPVSAFIPAFGESRVYRYGPAAAPVTGPAAEVVQVWHQL